jgi:hypothetical protein
MALHGFGHDDISLFPESERSVKHNEAKAWCSTPACKRLTLADATLFHDCGNLMLGRGFLRGQQRFQNRTARRAPGARQDETETRIRHFKLM